MKPEDQVKDSGKVAMCGMAPMKPDGGVVTDPRVTPPDKIGLHYAGVTATFSIPPTNAYRVLRAFGPVQEYEANPLLKLMMKNAAAANGAVPIEGRIAGLRAYIRECTEAIDDFAGRRALCEKELAQLQGVAPLTTVKEPFPVRALRDWVKWSGLS